MLRYPNLGFAIGLPLTLLALLTGALALWMLFTAFFEPELFLDRAVFMLGALVIGFVSGIWVIEAFDDDFGEDSTWRDVVISVLLEYGGGAVVAGIAVFELLLPVWAIIAQHLS